MIQLVGSGEKLEPITCWLKIQDDPEKESWYIDDDKRRWYYEDFEWASWPDYYEDSEGRWCFISAWEKDNYTHPVCMEVEPDTEWARLLRVVKE